MKMIDKLEKLMLKRELDKASLARNTNIPYTTIDGFWKKGTDNIKRSTLLKLTSYFNCTLDYLADDEVNIDYGREDLKLIPSEKELIKKYRTLDQRGKEMVDDVLNRQYEYVKPKSEDKAM